MKKAVIKVFALMLAVIMCVGVLAGCSGNADDPMGEPSEKPTEAPTAEPSEKQTEKPTEAPTAEPSETMSETPSENMSGTIASEASEGLEFRTLYDGSGFSVTGMGECTDKDIIIPNTYKGKPVKVIGDGAFNRYSYIESITIPDGVTSIGSGAFSGCSGLRSITIPDSVTSIGDYAFNNCLSLEYNIYENAKYLGNENNPHVVLIKATRTDITSCQIHINTKFIYDSAFYNCSRLARITVPDTDSVTSIGCNAFYGCSSLTRITIPNSVTSIEEMTFYGCSSLASIAIPNSVTSIGCNAFYGCSSLTRITIPNSVTSIEEMTFYGCSSLASIAIPNSVTSIGYNAFYECSGLTSITIPFVGATKDGETNTHFGYIFGAFNYSYNDDYVPSSLKRVIVSGGTGICKEAFYNCSSLTSITIPFVGATKDGETNTHFGYIFGAFNYSYNDDYVPSSLKRVIVSGGTGICKEAFYNCSSLTSITIPDSVMWIGNDAFHGCSKITRITIPDSVTSIGWSAFEGCSSLTSVTIGNSVTSIGNYAFYGCSSLTSVTIGNSLTSIGSSAFSGCSNLTDINYSGTKAEWKAISKGWGWDSSTGTVNYTVHCSDGDLTKVDS